MTEKMSPLAKQMNKTLRRVRRASKNFQKAFSFENAIRSANELLQGSVIKEVVGDEDPNGKTVKVVCEDGREFEVKTISGPGVNYDWDNRTVVSAKVHGATFGPKILDE